MLECKCILLILQRRLYNNKPGYIEVIPYPDPDPDSTTSQLRVWSKKEQIHTKFDCSRLFSKKCGAQNAIGTSVSVCDCVPKIILRNRLTIEIVYIANLMHTTINPANVMLQFG